MKIHIKLKLKDKIMLGFGSVLLIMLIVFLVSLFSLLKLGKASEAILKQNYLSIDATYQMLDAIEQHYLIFATASLKVNDLDIRALTKEQLRFEKWLQVELGNITEKGELAAAEKLEESYGHYINTCYALIKKGSSSPGLKSVNLETSLRPLVEKIRLYNFEIMQINKTGMFRSSEAAKHLAHKATVSLIVTGVIGVMLSIILSFTLPSLIVRPLKKILAALEKVAVGDYGIRIDYHSSDELGIVSLAFNRMVSKLSDYHEMNIRNIMKEKQINEALLLNMEDGLFLLDSDFHVINVNRSGAAFFNTDVAACQGRHLLEVIRHEALFEYVKETASTGKAPVIPEGSNVIMAGEEKSRRFLQFILTPVFEKNNVLLGVMVLVQDITHLKKLDKLKSEFLMIASHELKTPLTSLNMSVSLLNERIMGKLSDPEQELLRIALDDTNRLKALINDLLDLSKIEAGKIELSMELIDIGSVVSAVLNGFRNEMDTKQVSLEYNCNQEAFVKGDFSKIALILTNLISNAIRFTPTGGKITVKVELLGKYVQVSVADNGIGIPTEYHNRVFDKFFQVASNYNTGGTGLGLAISKEIVRAHGGSIWVESVFGEGSTFYFTLPLG